MGKLFDKLPSILPPIKSPSETMNDLSRPGDALHHGDGPRRPVRPRRTARPTASRPRTSSARARAIREGKSLNADSAEKCSAKVLIPGRQRKPDDCRTDTFVTSALCQKPDAMTTAREQQGAPMSRTEQDFLGQREIADDIYYGVQTIRG